MVAGPLAMRALFLQRTAGNAAVARLARSGAVGLMPGRRMLARDVATAPVTFADPELQKIYDANKPGTLSQQVAPRLGAQRRCDQAEPLISVTLKP